MDDDLIVIPAEERMIIVMDEIQTIEVPAEWRVIEVQDAVGQ